MDRRTFIATTSCVTAAAAAATGTSSAMAAEQPSSFASDLHDTPDRVWPGPQYWTNPLQDWRVQEGRLECIHAAPGRNVHLLTHDIAGGAGDITCEVVVGSLDAQQLSSSKAAAGFLIGVKGELTDYRHHLIFGQGIFAGIRGGNELVIGNGPQAPKASIALDVKSVKLVLRATLAEGADKPIVELQAIDPTSGKVLGSVKHQQLAAASIAGNIALSANFAPAGAAGKKNSAGPARPPERWWFNHWKLSGSLVRSHADRTFGPICFVHYSVHARRFKLTAQLAPLSTEDSATATLQMLDGATWKSITTATIDADARTARFAVDNIDPAREQQFRVVTALSTLSGKKTEHVYNGVLRAEPTKQQPLKVADISCNAHYAFPNTECAAAVAKLDPDLMAFTGDQYYEPTGGFGVDRRSVESSLLDVLRKWMMHGWTWRELTRSRPSISIPDDHDVYHGNLWGEGGKEAPGIVSVSEAKGGYKMYAEFVNVVHRQQTSHHPDSPAKPEKQGITGYFGPLTWGGVSFAILADRQYKSGPDGKVPPTTSGRADHVNDPNFDPSTADMDGLSLLGEQQTNFLREWTTDWTDASLKAVISQTIFTAMATHHGKNDNFLVADYDTNAWPQRARDTAVELLRSCAAVHLAGDQHLPAVVQYGSESARDGGFAFASPAVNNLYPRWFLPKTPGTNRPEAADGHLGDFSDSFGHPLTVVAVANPQLQFSGTLLEREVQKSAGYGMVTFDKVARTMEIGCWPLLVDPTQATSQFAGWPVRVSQVENLGNLDGGELPELIFEGAIDPLLELCDDNGAIVYTLRIAGNKFKPRTRKLGAHKLKVRDEASGKSASLELVAEKKNDATQQVSLS